MLDLSRLALDDIADALADQGPERQWLIDPDTGEILFWTSDTGIDGKTPVDIEDVDAVVIEPLPPSIWYRDMADFAGLVSDERAQERLMRAIQERSAFRKFKDVLYQRFPDLVPDWRAFSEARARRRAVQWLADSELIDENAAGEYIAEHPLPELP